jgi:hypothetical protein
VEEAGKCHKLAADQGKPWAAARDLSEGKDVSSGERDQLEAHARDPEGQAQYSKCLQVGVGIEKKGQ